MHVDPKSAKCEHLKSDLVFGKPQAQECVRYETSTIKLVLRRAVHTWWRPLYTKGNSWLHRLFSIYVKRAKNWVIQYKPPGRTSPRTATSWPPVKYKCTVTGIACHRHIITNPMFTWAILTVHVQKSLHVSNFLLNWSVDCSRFLLHATRHVEVYAFKYNIKPALIKLKAVHCEYYSCLVSLSFYRGT